jgi:replication-associated recombination protein RarA
MNMPQCYNPVEATQFIGPANRIAMLLAQKATAINQAGATIKLLLTGNPGCGKTKLAEFMAARLAQCGCDVQSWNGRNVNAEVVRRWTDESRYIATRYQVVIVNEIDTVTTSAQDLMLSYLDGLGGKRAIVGTSNLNLSDLTPRFQSRFQQIQVKSPSSDEITALLKSFGLNGAASAIAEKCKGDVRAALNDAQTVLDAQFLGK